MQKMRAGPREGEMDADNEDMARELTKLKILYCRPLSILLHFMLKSRFSDSVTSVRNQRLDYRGSAKASP